MHVAIASAHFPPDFVSGGTLVPWREARGLRRRGHDVSVFAGSLHTGTPHTGNGAGSRWRSFDEELDVDVDWIDVGAWTSWSDPRNYDNPVVAEAFGTWLDEVRPDVVHLHSLQTFGAGAVLAATQRDLPTVVTMHDFWWLCSRQFLADASGRACSLVVDAGGCPCESGRDALDARAGVLAPALAAVDLVVAPSHVTRQVLVANGIAADRIVVNENGSDPVPSAQRVEDESVVRFRYTGGGHEMKGARVLADALARVPASADWTCTIHAPADQRAVFSGLADHASVRLEEPYDPAAVAEVWAATDVLVLPSVMRETHSIVTREALGAGVAVITSDSLGPEEVVVDGTNGLVVDSGDVDQLAAAIDRLRQRSTLTALRPEPGGALGPTIEDQVAEIEQILVDVAGRGTPAAAPSTPPPRHVVYAVGIEGAPLLYRARFPAEALELLGIETTVLHYNDPRLDGALDGADAVVFYRVPATTRVLASIERTRARGVPVLFDVDDLIVDPSVAEEIPALRILPADEAAQWLDGVARYRTTLEHCDAFVGSTRPLVERVAAVTGMPAHLKPNAYGLHVARRSDAALRRERTDGPLRIGYLSGTRTHDEDLHAIVPALVRVLDERTDIELWLGGHLPEVDELTRFGDRVRRLAFRPWFELPDLLRDLDVNLAPLADRDTFNQAKSAIKWLEAALVATPTVATATVPFSEAIDDGRTGLLVADADPDAWARAILALLDDDLTRERMGGAARRAALLEWSPHTQGRLLVDIFGAVAGRDARRSDAGWVDVAPVEAPAAGPVPLTPYPDGPGVAPAPNTAGVTAVGGVDPRPGPIERLRWVIDHEGWAGVAARAARAGRSGARAGLRYGRRAAGRVRRELDERRRG